MGEGNRMEMLSTRFGLVHGGRLSLLPDYPASPLCSQTKEHGQAATAYLSLAGRWNGASLLPGPLGNDSARPVVESVYVTPHPSPLPLFQVRKSKPGEVG